MLLQDARAVADQMDGFKARVKTLREELERELSLSINVMYPTSESIDAAATFRDTFPHTPLRLLVEVLGAVRAGAAARVVSSRHEAMRALELYASITRIGDCDER